VAAQIGTGTIDAGTDVDVNAVSKKNVRTIAVSLGVGFVGAAGSVAVWTVGTNATTTYSDEGNSKDPLSSGGNSSTSEADSTAMSKPEDWHSGGEYKKGTIVRDGGQNYVAKNDIVGTGLNPGSKQRRVGRLADERLRLRAQRHLGELGLRHGRCHERPPQTAPRASRTRRSARPRRPSARRRRRSRASESSRARRPS